MPTELEELVEFLHHGNTQLRQTACEHLVGYSIAQPAIFKVHQLLPVRDLKLLVKDYPLIAENALTILINLSHDDEVLGNLAQDDVFLETLLKKISNPKDSTTNSLCMLLANLVKHPSLSRLIKLERSAASPISKSLFAMDQLMDCFISTAPNPKSATSTRSPSNPSYDYLSYTFASLSAQKDGRTYFLTPQPYDTIVPLTKLTPFTENASHVRRAGVASTIKNLCFETEKHSMLLKDPPSGANLLTYVLLPLAGPEDLGTDTEEMLPDLQLLPPDKERESDPAIQITHLETLLLLTTNRETRDLMRNCGVYPVVRECHAAVENEEVRDAADRVVQVLMRKEEGEPEDDFVMKDGGGAGKMIQEDRSNVVAEEDDDEKIVEIF